ncbi:MAG: hypothetical protein M1820_001632 [Bogoriella megaspora]|nr:MAG: hypothetical protein M1820_001632 [Bogoriella megaspora]
MPAQSLLTVCQRTLAKHIDQLEDIGNVPYEFIRPALLKIHTAEQLQQLEQNCPQLVGQDGEIWLNLIKRDIPNWENRPHTPKDPTKWWKVYRKLQNDVAEEQREAEEKLIAALNKHQAQKEEKKSTFIQKALDPGKTGKTTSLTRWDGKSWNREQPKPKATPIGKLLQSNNAPASRTMSTPTHLLQNKASRVTQVPKGMLGTHTAKPPTVGTIGHSGSQPRFRHSPDRKPFKIFAPGRNPKTTLDRELSQEEKKQREARERRLKEIQAGQKPTTARSEPATAGSPPASSKPTVTSTPPPRASTPMSAPPSSPTKPSTPNRDAPPPFGGLPSASGAPLSLKRKRNNVFMSNKKIKT